MVLIEAVGRRILVPNRSLWFREKCDTLPSSTMLVLFFASPFEIKRKWGWWFYTNFSQTKTSSIIQQTHLFFCWEKHHWNTTQTHWEDTPLVSTWMEVSRPCCYSLGSSIAPCRRQEGVFWEMDFRQNFSLFWWLVTDPFEQLCSSKKIFETSSYNSQNKKHWLLPAFY